MLKQAWKAAACVALAAMAGCATPAQRAQDQQEMNASVPVCETERQCKAEWDAAITWVTDNCGMKIQTLNDNLIQTYNSPPDSTKTACTVVKQTGTNRSFGLTARIGCSNLFGCFPKPKDMVVAFGNFVGKAGLPYQPLKIGARLSSVDSRGNTTQILAEGVGMKITEVAPGGRASAAGLQVDDVIKSLNGKRIRNADDWQQFIATVSPGDTVAVGVRRAAQDIEISMPL